MNAKRLLQALDFAATRHRGQRRKCGKGVPYINHPIRVARLLADVGGVQDEDVLVAAILHDILVGTATSAEELEAGFGPVVRRLVEEVTDDKRLRKSERRRRQVARARELSTGAAFIRLADKLAIVRDLTTSPPAGWSRQRVQDHLRWAVAVVRNCPKVNSRLEARFAKAVQKAKQKLAKP